MAASTTTTTSQELSTPSVTGSQASAYLLQLISLQLKQTGFDAVEAGALSEVLRLTERYTQTLAQRAASLAAQSSRPTINALDLFEAYHSISPLQPRSTTEQSNEKHADGVTGQVRDLVKLARRDKRARAKGRFSSKGLELTYTTPPPSPPSPIMLTLSDSDSGSEEEDEWEEVPIGGGVNGVGGKKNKHRKRNGTRQADADPGYLFEGAPRLPPEHSYRRKAVIHDTNGLTPHNQTLSSTLLSFIKATAVERGDIPSELGLVDYRRAGESETQTQTVKKRRWNVCVEPDDEDDLEMVIT